MAQSIKKLTNHSLQQIHKTKLVNSISQLCNDTVNKSFSFDQSNQSDLDNQQLLKMQIKQLKRENTFLKGKIQQLKKGIAPHQPKLLKRQSLNCINILKKKQDNKLLIPQQNSLNFILQQIENILKSLASIYKIQPDQKVWIGNNLLIDKEKQQQLIQIKASKQYKEKLNKKLQKISLQKEQARYNSLLQIFIQYYKIKAQEEKKIKSKIQKYIEKTIDISKKLIENANHKAYQKSMRSSCIYSVQSVQFQNNQNLINNHQTSINDSFIYAKAKFNGSGLEKHQLSYSTIDAINSQKQMY